MSDRRFYNTFMAVLFDKWVNRIMYAMWPVLFLMVFMPHGSIVKDIAFYISYILFAAAIIRIIYIIATCRKNGSTEFDPEKHKMNRGQMITFYSLHTAVFTVIFIFTLIYKIPVALPASAILVAITVTAFILALRKNRK